MTKRNHKLSDTSKAAPAIIPLLLTARGATERYSLARSTVRRLVNQGHLKTIQVGTQTLIHVPSADAYFESLLPKEPDFWSQPPPVIPPFE